MSDWTKINASDPATLPTVNDSNEDGNVLWRNLSGSCFVMAWDADPRLFDPRRVAWMTIPPYTPPEKPKRREWAMELQPTNNAPCDGFIIDQPWKCVPSDCVHVREVLPTDIDPDAALRLLEAAREFAETWPMGLSRLQSAIDAATPKKSLVAE